MHMAPFLEVSSTTGSEASKNSTVKWKSNVVVRVSAAIMPGNRMAAKWGGFHCFFLLEALVP